MKGDFSRDTFDPDRGYSRVLQQQGRVQLDADWNEQVSIQVHALRSLARDLIGPHGGPIGDLGFALEKSDEGFDFSVSSGVYYVSGIRCVNRAGKSSSVGYRSQPYLSPPKPLEANTKYLLYLDVWEREITAVQDPRLREVALGGPDTALRAQVVWQVKAVRTQDVAGYPNNETPEAVRKYFDEQVRPTLVGRGKLRASSADRTAHEDKDCCTTPPGARFRGAENQLYRVEIHRGGDTQAAKAGPTFRWSRDNATVVFPILELKLPDTTSDQITVQLEHLGRDGRSTLSAGDWVELYDDDAALDPAAAAESSLFRVMSVNRSERTVTLLGKLAGEVGQSKGRHPLLRRWDHTPADGSKAVAKDALRPVQAGVPVPLEDGIQIEFGAGHYRAGDYWLIPARLATGDVEWPEDAADARKPAWLGPHGVNHHHAPLAVLEFEPGGAFKSTPLDLRRSFKSLTDL